MAYQRKHCDEPEIPGKCNACKKNNTRCRNKPEKNGRCKFHGGKSTGPVTQEGKDIIRANALKHGLHAKVLTPWQQHVLSKYDEKTQELWESIPSDGDLGEQIRQQMLKVDNLERSLATCRQMAMLEIENAAETEVDESGGVVPRKTRYMGCTVKDWEQLLDAGRDVLRKLIKTQKEVDPGNKTRGNLHFTISVKDEVAAADKEEIPDLTGEGEQPTLSPEESVEETPEEKGTGNAIIDSLDDE